MICYTVSYNFFIVQGVHHVSCHLCLASRKYDSQNKVNKVYFEMLAIHYVDLYCDSSRLLLRSIQIG